MFRDFKSYHFGIETTVAVLELSVPVDFKSYHFGIETVQRGTSRRRPGATLNRTILELKLGWAIV